MPRKPPRGEGEGFGVPPSETPLRDKRPETTRAEPESERQRWERQVSELKEQGLLTDSLLERLKILSSCENAEDWEVVRDLGASKRDENYEQGTRMEATLEAGRQYAEKAHEMLNEVHNAIRPRAGRVSEGRQGIPDWNEIQKYASNAMLELLLEENTAERLLAPQQRARLDATMTTYFVQSGRQTAYDYPRQALQDPGWMVKSVVAMLRGGIVRGGMGPNYSHVPTTLWRRDFLTILRKFAEDDELRPFIFTWPPESTPWERSEVEPVLAPEAIDDLASHYYAMPLTQRKGIFYHRREIGEVTHTRDLEDDDRITKIGQLNRGRVQEALEKMRAMLPGVLAEQERRRVEELAQLRTRLRGGELRTQLVEIAKVTEQIIRILEQREQLVREHQEKRGGKGIGGTLKRAIYGRRLDEVARAVQRIDKVEILDARNRRVHGYGDILLGVYGMEAVESREQLQQQPEIRALMQRLNDEVKKRFVVPAMAGKKEEARQGLDSLAQELIAEMDKTIAREK